MSLLTPVGLKAITDEFSGLYIRWSVSAGNAGSPLPGSDLYLSTRAALVLAGRPDIDIESADPLVGCADVEQANDMGPALLDLQRNTNVGFLVATLLRFAMGSVDGHISARGPGVSASIVDLPSYLTYLNGGGGGAPYSCLLHPGAGVIYSLLGDGTLPPGGLFQLAIHPALSGSTNGMGARSVGGSFVAGDSANVVRSSPTGVVEVVADFGSGGAHPTVTVSGIDDTGANTTTWTASGATNNPVQAISTTITPAVTAQALQTVALASVSGIVAGSVLRVSPGLIDDEYIIVEGLSGSTISAVFLKGHSAGATLTGSTTLALVPSVSGRRIASVSNIVLGISGHTTGGFRVCGVQERQYAP